MKRLIAAIVALLACGAPAFAQEELTVSKIYLGGATVSNPSSTGVSIGAGTLTAGTFSGSCASCTSIPAGNLTGTITSSVQDNITRLGTVSSITGLSTDLVPTFADTYRLGTPFKPWLRAHISEMSATLFAKSTQTLYGGWLAVTKNAGALPSSVSAAATTIDFGQAMTANQFVLIRAADNNSGAVGVEYLKVGTLVSGTTYNVTRNLDGSGANDWAAGTPYAVRGVAGDGWLELNAFDTPRMSVFTQGSLYNNSTESIRIGHLTGMPNSSSGIGAYMGDATNYFRWDGSNLKVVGADATIDNSGFTLGSNTSSGYLAGAALKYRRASASGYGSGTGDVFGAYTSSVNVGSQTDTLTIENTMVTPNNGGGFAGNVGRALVSLVAKGWNTAAAGSAQPTASIDLDSGAAGAATSKVTVTATTDIHLAGPVTTTSTITERARTTPMGEWTSVAFAGGNFTASGSMTWTVDSGDQVTYAYKLVGKSLTVAVWLATTTVGGTLSTQLNVAIPGGFVSAKAMSGATGAVLDNGAGVPGVVSVAAGGTVLVVQRADLANFTAATNNTQVRFTFEFEIQ
jgi:hypothetical protein